MGASGGVYAPPASAGSKFGADFASSGAGGYQSGPMTYPSSQPAAAGSYQGISDVSQTPAF